jgi:hypothetical protein
MNSALTAIPSVPDSMDTFAWFTKVIGKLPRLRPIETCTTLDYASSQVLTAHSRVDLHEDWAPVLVPPLRRSADERFRLLQLWVGVVQEIVDDGLVVTLFDQTNRQYPEEEVTISISEIPEHDFPLLQPGSVLYWSIGYREGQGLPRERISRIRARRLPVWSENDLERGRVNAQKVIIDFN